MFAFDRLPKALRVALANADHNWSGQQLLNARRKKHPQVKTIAQAIAFIKAADAKMHNAADCGVMPGQR